MIDGLPAARIENNIQKVIEDAAPDRRLAAAKKCAPRSLQGCESAGQAMSSSGGEIAEPPARRQ